MGPGDTIAAVATPAGPGGVGIIRISGPVAIEIAAGLVRVLPGQLVDRRARRGIACDADGQRLDDVLVLAMRAPRSFTGEDVAEIHGHGGVVNVARLLRAVLARGARPAAPGEFTRRAVEHGRLDLQQAEALLQVVAAGSERAWRIAQDQLGGALGDRVRGWRDRGVALLAEIEASIDFPDEDLELATTARLLAECDALAQGAATLAATFAMGRAVRDGLVVALAGLPNAGKSSLFNALVGRERSIVSAAPGTTRDYVEARVEWDGLDVTLVDTAGLRDVDDEIERRGVELARARLDAADVIVWASERAEDDAGAAGFGARGIAVRTKGDLGAVAPVTGVVTSATTGQGLEALRTAVLTAAGAQASAGAAEVVITSERQRDELVRASLRFAAAAVALRSGVALEMPALEVRDGLGGLAAVLGEEVGEAVRDVLFAKFCIGK